MSAGTPAELSWKPDVIYSLPNGKTYAFHPIQGGSSAEINWELILLDHSEVYEATISQFGTMFAIDRYEDVRGDCANFSWIDRRQGKFRISPNPSKKTSFCFVGNITGFTTAGNAVFLPAIWYFVTSKQQP